jgi:hypothetical protein
MSTKMSVEAELWRIFTFYSLHYDASNPEIWKITPFIRFAKDCQITGPKFMVSELELEIVRLVRNKRKNMKVDGINGKDFDSAHTIIITFPDFLRLLEIIAIRVYPVIGKNGLPDEAACLRRILLENVLFLANRRSDHIEKLCSIKCDETAIATVRETFGKSLMGIFKYYNDLADKRRSQELAAEAVKSSGVTNRNNRDLDAVSVAQSKSVRASLRSQKDLISFQEYTQFCHDFSLKSTSLLTAIEVGEIFLNVVEYDKKEKVIKGMSFGNFCDAILAMAMLAYRTAPVTGQNKVKSLLQFMWRGVNQSDKRTQAVAVRTAMSSNQHAGSLNQFGSGAFCDFFLKQWISEDFPNYTEPAKPPQELGSNVLSRIIGSRFKTDEDDNANDSEEGDEESKGNGNGDGDGDAEDKPKGKGQTGENVVLHGFLLAALFRTQPELAEMVYLEMREMIPNGELTL